MSTTVTLGRAVGAVVPDALVHGAGLVALVVHRGRPGRRALRAGDPGDAVPTGCVACDTTVANMAWTGLGFAGVGAGVLALLAAGNL